MRSKLEYLCDKVDALLAAHYTPGRVVGGTVGPERVRLFVKPAPYVGLSAIVALRGDLAAALDAPDLDIARGDGVATLIFAPSDGLLARPARAVYALEVLV